MPRSRIAILVAFLAAAAGLALYVLLGRAAPEPIDGATDDTPSPVAVPAGHDGDDPNAATKPVAPRQLRRGRFARKHDEKGEPVTIEGKVVDERRRPVASATVALRVPELSAAETTSDAEGRFRLALVAAEDVEPSDAGGLFARDREGRVGFTRLFLVAADAGAGEGPTIELHPATSLEVRVVDEHGGIGGVRVIAWAGPDEGLGETGVRIGEGWTRADGRADIEGLPFDAIALVAVAADGRRARAGTRITGEKPPPVTIEFEDRRDVLLHVTAGRPLRSAAGARVVLGRSIGGDADALLPYDPPIEVAPTDERGETHLVGLPPGDTPSLRVVLADGTTHVPSIRAEADAWEVTVLGPRDACDWAVVAGASPVPPEGSMLVLEVAPGARPLDLPRGRIVGETIHVEGLPRAASEVFARAPDGSIAHLFVRDLERTSDPVSFHPLRRVEVFLKEEGVGPMVGAGVLLRDDGGCDVSAVVETDATGRALLESPYDFRLDERPVFVALTVGYPDVIELAALDPKHPEAPIRIFVPRERTATLHLTVDGAPTIPLSPEWAWLDVSHVRVAEAPEAGTLVVRYRASADAKALPRFVLSAPGFHKATISLPRVGADPKSSHDVPLERTGALHVRVKRTKGVPTVLQLERREISDVGGPAGDDRDNLPGRATSWRLLYRPAPVEAGDVVTYDPVEPGLYRMRDATSGVVTAPFEVFSKGGATEAIIDLSDLVRVRGHVEARGGGSVRAVRVLVTAFGIDFYDGLLPGKGLAPDGTFDLWLPANREPTIRAARVGGSQTVEGPPVTISGAKSDVVLTVD